MPPTKAPTSGREPSGRNSSGKSPARQPAKGRPMRSIAPANGRALSLGGRGQGLTNLLRDLRSEIRRVIWPAPRQAINMTAVIVALSAGLGAFLGLVDFGFQELFRVVLQWA